MKFYKCNICGNIFSVVEDSGVNPVCCDQPMELLKTNTVDGVGEKHVPVIERDGDKVTVKIGSAPHPMLPEHHIMFVAIRYGDHCQMQHLKVSGEPQAEFVVSGNDEITAYAYCNIHGLWKS
ncbi:desulfoferrodoxin [Candidatus Saccharibacteria bacterium]|nr:desulfoferrodoxin [Candidatus Saccharibacteria bacterium]